MRSPTPIVAALVFSCAASVVFAAPAPVAHYKFDEASGDSLHQAGRTDGEEPQKETKRKKFWEK